MKQERLIDEIAAAIGPEAHAALLAELGGRRLVIPKKVGPHHPLTVAIGAGPAATLSAEFAGATLDLPVTAKKRALIIEALKRNEKPYAIAQRYLCTPRFVFKVQAEMRENDTIQGTLL